MINCDHLASILTIFNDILTVDHLERHFDHLVRHFDHLERHFDHLERDFNLLAQILEHFRIDSLPPPLHLQSNRIPINFASFYRVLRYSIRSCLVNADHTGCEGRAHCRAQELRVRQQRTTHLYKNILIAITLKLCKTNQLKILEIIFEKHA